MLNNRFLKKAISVLLVFVFALSSLPVYAEGTLYPEQYEWQTLYPNGLLNFEHTEYTVLEGEGSLDINIIRMGGTQGEVRVELNITDVNAAYGEDYSLEGAGAMTGDQAVYGLALTFLEGECSKPVRIHFQQDEISENKEIFLLSLVNAQNGAVIGENGSIPIAIEDDEARVLPVVEIASSTYNANPAAGATEITILRRGGEQQMVSFDFSTRSGTAAVGLDYQGVTSSVLLNPGELEKKITIPLLNSEATGKSFYFELSNVQGGVLGSVSSCEIMLIDTDSTIPEYNDELVVTTPNAFYTPLSEASALTPEMFKQQGGLLFELPEQNAYEPNAINALPLAVNEAVHAAADSDSFSKSIVIHDSSSANVRLGFKTLKNQDACEQYFGTAANGRLGFYYNAKNSKGQSIISSRESIDLTGIDRIRITWRNNGWDDHQYNGLYKAYFTRTCDLNSQKFMLSEKSGQFDMVDNILLMNAAGGPERPAGRMHLNFMIEKNWTSWFQSDPIMDVFITRIELERREYEMIINPSANGEIRLIKQQGMFSLGHATAVRDDVFYIDARPDPGWQFTGYKVDRKCSEPYGMTAYSGNMITVDSDFLWAARPYDDIEGYNKIHIAPVFERIPQTTRITITSDYADVNNLVHIGPGGSSVMTLPVNVRTEYNYANKAISTITFTDNDRYKLLFWNLPDGRLVKSHSFQYDLSGLPEVSFKAVVAPVTPDGAVQPALQLALPTISWMYLNNNFIPGGQKTLIPRADTTIRLTVKANWKGETPRRLHFIIRSSDGMTERKRYTLTATANGAPDAVWNDINQELNLMNDFQAGDRLYVRLDTTESEASEVDTGISIVTPQQFSTVDTSRFDPRMAFSFKPPFTIPLVGEPNFSLGLAGIDMKGELNRSASTYTITAGYAKDMEKFKQSIDKNNSNIPFVDWFKNPLNAAGNKLNDYISNMKDAAQRAMAPGTAPGINLNVKPAGGLRVVFQFNDGTNEWEPREGWVYIGGKLKVTQVYYFMISAVPAFISLGADVDLKVFTGMKYQTGPITSTLSWEGIDIESQIKGNITGGVGLYNVAALTATGALDLVLNGTLLSEGPARFTKGEIELSLGVGLQCLGFSYNYKLAKQKWDLLGAPSAVNELAPMEIPTFEPTERDLKANGSSMLDDMANQASENIGDAKVYSFSDADPQLISFTGDKKLLVFLEDDPERSDADRARLMFTLYDGNAWSEPMPVDDDGTSDYMPAVTLIGSDALVVWLDNTVIYGDEQPEMRACLNNYKASAAVIDLSQQQVRAESIQTMSNHLYHDNTPTVAGNNTGNALSVWKTTNFEEEITDMESFISAPSILMYSTLDPVTQDWQDAQPLPHVLTGEILSSSLFYSNGYFIFAYSASADNDLVSEEDEELFVQLYNPAEATWSEPKRLSYNFEKDSNPILLKAKDTKDILFWQSGKSIRYFEMDLLMDYLLHPDNYSWADPAAGLASDARTAVQLELDSHPGDLAAAASADGQIVLLWKDTGKEVPQALFASFGEIDEEGAFLWSKPRQISDSNMLIRALTLTCDSSGRFYTVFAHNEVLYDNDSGEYKADDTALAFASIELTKDIKVDDDQITVSNRSPRAGEWVDIQAYVVNDGELSLKPGELEVNVYSVINGVKDYELAETNSETLAPGYEQGAVIAFAMPAAENHLEGVGFEFSIAGKTIDKTIAFEKTPKVEITNLSRSVLPDGSCKMTATIVNEGNEAAADLIISLQHLDSVNLTDDGDRIYKTPSGITPVTLERLEPAPILSEAVEGGDDNGFREIEFVYWPDEAYCDESGVITLRLVVKAADEFCAEQIFYLHRNEFAKDPENPITNSGSSNESAASHFADVKVANGSNITLSVTVDNKTESASIDLSPLGTLSPGETEIDVPAVPDVTEYTVGMPVSYLSASNSKGKLTVNTAAGSMTLPSSMLSGVLEAGGSKAEITIGEGDKSRLPYDLRAAIGDRPLIRITLAIDGRQTNWNNSSTPVTLSIPYTPTATELAHPENIVIWYIGDDGNATSVSNGRYNPATGTVTFFTTHFSDYTVAYVHKTFSDLGKAEWARKAIEVMASKGITSGTGYDTFSPYVNISRADYMVLLINTLGLTADYTENFDDVAPGAYYSNAVGIAKKLGIATGSGKNRFSPDSIISRQDMMALAARALEKCQGLKKAEHSTTLEKFSDKEDIAGYAADNLASLVEMALIAGSGNRLYPRSFATRAEAAVFLYNIYCKYPETPKVGASMP